MPKQPKLVLRESSIQDLSNDWPAGTFVEMGAGTGGMTRLFLDRGFTGACHDLGADSRAMMRANLADYGQAVRVPELIDELPKAAYDYLLAFEVLEHVNADLNLTHFQRDRRSKSDPPGSRSMRCSPA